MGTDYRYHIRVIQNKYKHDLGEESSLVKSFIVVELLQTSRFTQLAFKSRTNSKYSVFAAVFRQSQSLCASSQKVQDLKLQRKQN